jgi:hypothetical protein
MEAFQITHKYSKRAKANWNWRISGHFPIAIRTLEKQSFSKFVSSQRSNGYSLQCIKGVPVEKALQSGAISRPRIGFGDNCILVNGAKLAIPDLDSMSLAG